MMSCFTEQDDISNWDCWASYQKIINEPNETKIEGYQNVTEAFSANCFYGILMCYVMYANCIFLIAPITHQIKYRISQLALVLLIVFQFRLGLTRNSHPGRVCSGDYMTADEPYRGPFLLNEGLF